MKYDTLTMFNSKTKGRPLPRETSTTPGMCGTILPTISYSEEYLLFNPAQALPLYSIHYQLASPF